MATRREVATALGISRQRVEQLVRDGRIEERNGSIDLETARASYASSIDPARRLAYAARTAIKSPSSLAVPPHSYVVARTEKEQANAMRAQLEYKIKAGHFISRDEVAAKEFAIARKMRDRILGLPARIANLVPPDAMKTITDECDALIRAIQADVAIVARDGPQ